VTTKGGRIMSMKKWLIGGLAAIIAVRWANSQIKRREKTVELVDNLNRWEGEGGNVPPVDPALPNAAAIPVADKDKILLQ